MTLKQFPRIVTLSSLCLAIALPAMAQTGRSVPVTVQNLPDVVAIEDIDHPARQPMQFSDTRTHDISSGGTTLLFHGLEAGPVPEGKRLVVQHISYSVRSAAMLGDSLCSARVHNDSFTVHFTQPLPLTASVWRDEKVLTVSLPITLYAGPGEFVGVACSTRVSGEDLVENFGMSGYYVDL